MAKEGSSTRGKRPAGGKQTGAGNRGQRAGQGAVKKGSAFTYSNAASKAGRTTPKGDTRVKGSSYRSEATIKRLHMYNNKPDMKRRREESMKPMRIQPDRRWFGNTRTIAQDKMQAFRETLAKGVEDPFSVVLKSSKLPMSLLKEAEEKSTRMKLLEVEPFNETFGKRRRQKRVKLGNYDLDALMKSAEQKAAGYGAGSGDRGALYDAAGFEKPEVGEGPGSGAIAGEEIFSKGTSERIWKELYKVVDASDIIIFVLDARDPMGTRCRALEKHIRKDRPNKHIVLVMNKVDLVPTWVSRRWIFELMKDFPALAFHSSITNPFGKSALLNLLRQFSTLLKDKRHVSIGVLGYPNVGKSSVINTMKRKKVCKAAPVPGETKVWQYIALSNRLYIIDCPGIVPLSASDFDSNCAKVLKGAVRAERIESPEDYIDEVLSRVKKQYLLQKYKLPPDTEWKDADEFLTMLAHKMGKLRRGGEPDLVIVARMVLYDWQRGRIPFFTPPPEDEEEEEEEEAKAKDSQAAAAEPGEKTAAIKDAAKNASEEKVASAAGSSSSGARPDAPVVQQSLSELVCKLEYDEEDRRGEAVGDSEAAVAEHDAGSGDEGRDDKEGGDDATKPAKRMKRTKRAPAVEEDEAARPKKKNRRGKGGSKLGDGEGGGGSASSHPVQKDSMDWKKVVAEFGM